MGEEGGDDAVDLGDCAARRELGLRRRCFLRAPARREGECDRPDRGESQQHV